MTRACPLDPLIVARRVRRDSAMKRVVACRERVSEQETACARIQLRIDLLDAERRNCRQRLSDLFVAAGTPSDLGRVDERSALLAIRASEAQAELLAAERALEAIRSELAEAVHEFLRAESRLEALLEQRTAWSQAATRRGDRQEEAISDDLVAHRAVNRR